MKRFQFIAGLLGFGASLKAQPLGFGAKPRVQPDTSDCVQHGDDLSCSFFGGVRYPVVNDLPKHPLVVGEIVLLLQPMVWDGKRWVRIS